MLAEEAALENFRLYLVGDSGQSSEHQMLIEMLLVKARLGRFPPGRTASAVGLQMMCYVLGKKIACILFTSKDCSRLRLRAAN